VLCEGGFGQKKKKVAVGGSQDLNLGPPVAKKAETREDRCRKGAVTQSIKEDMEDARDASGSGMPDRLSEQTDGKEGWGGGEESNQWA
jgi:hypothetical protein